MSQCQREEIYGKAHSGALLTLHDPLSQDKKKKTLAKFSLEEFYSVSGKRQYRLKCSLCRLVSIFMRTQSILEVLTEKNSLEVKLRNIVNIYKKNFSGVFLKLHLQGLCYQRLFSKKNHLQE